MQSLESKELGKVKRQEPMQRLMRLARQLQPQEASVAKVLSPGAQASDGKVGASEC